MVEVRSCVRRRNGRDGRADEEPTPRPGREDGTLDQALRRRRADAARPPPGGLGAARTTTYCGVLEQVAVLIRRVTRRPTRSLVIVGKSSTAERRKHAGQSVADDPRNRCRRTDAALDANRDGGQVRPPCGRNRTRGRYSRISGRGNATGRESEREWTIFAPRRPARGASTARYTARGSRPAPPRETLRRRPQVKARRGSPELS